MAKYIIFDLGNVLIHIHPQLAISKFEENCDVEQSDVGKFFLSDLHLGFMKGLYSTEEFYQTMMSEYPCSLNQVNFHKIWNDVIGQPKQGIREIIEELKACYSLAICSNTDPWHWQKVLHEVPFIMDFGHYYLSFEMKLNKPDPAVFEYILTTLAVGGSDCIFIDDTAENIDIAREFGMVGITASEPGVTRDELKRLNILKNYSLSD